jgi:hypothetical protein
MLHNQFSQTVHVFGSAKYGVFFYVHSILSFGIIFWGNSFYNTSIFKIQRRIIRVIIVLILGTPAVHCLDS